ncbi:MAG: class III signal peptide-containing protein [Candidatus Micrarchaeota archaeon]
MEFIGNKKGQGATEYLVLLAVVLVVAMVAIALLLFFPEMTYDAKARESSAYWQGAAHPFAVLDHAESAGSTNLTLIVQNTEAEQKQLTVIDIGGNGVTGTLNLTDAQKFFSGGEKRALQIGLSNNCTSGNVYEYYINFTFSNADNSITNQKQYGAKTLVGKCN